MKLPVGRRFMPRVHCNAAFVTCMSSPNMCSSTPVSMNRRANCTWAPVQHLLCCKFPGYTAKLAAFAGKERLDTVKIHSTATPHPLDRESSRAKTPRAWWANSYGPASCRADPGYRRTPRVRGDRCLNNVYAAACRNSSRHPPVEWIVGIQPSYRCISQQRRPG
jgi:hypothetical protein